MEDRITKYNRLQQEYYYKIKEEKDNFILLNKELNEILDVFRNNHRNTMITFEDLSK